MDLQKYLGFDTETWLIGAESVVPHIVCFSAASFTSWEDYDMTVIGNHPEEEQEEKLRFILKEDSHMVVHNWAFDGMVLCVSYPDLIPLVFDKMERGQVHDTLIREMMLDLHDHGSIGVKLVRGDRGKHLSYRLDEVLKRYTGIDISSSKGEDTWRMRYSELDGIKSADYPEEAYRYAGMDSVYTIPVLEAQEDRARQLERDTGVYTFKTEPLRVKAALALSFMTYAGDVVDGDKVKEIQALMKEELDPAKHKKLYSSGILRKAVPPRPHSKGVKDHRVECPGNKQNPYYKGTVKDCDCPVKMTKGKKESKSTKVLHQFILDLAEKNKKVKVEYTEPSKKFPEGQVKTNDDWMQRNKEFDKSGTLEQFCHREGLMKIVNNYLNRLVGEDGEPVKVIHASFDILKETGRTSSKSTDHYPSWNCQQVDPRVRPSIKPRPGCWKLSTDYSALELCTVAQTCLNLFGYSELAEVINKGEDSHAFMAARIAFEFDDDFKELCISLDRTSQWEIFEVFKQLKHGTPEQQEFYYKYRKVAKPVGLGFPGGLGEKTMVEFSRGYGVSLTLQMSKALRKFWKEVFPEMPTYLEYINSRCLDPINVSRTFLDGDKEKTINLYRYTTPFGMMRSGCTYTAAANGLGLQSPAAEGALTAVYNLINACYCDDSNVLYGNYIPTMFIHDEIVGDIVINDKTQEVIKAKEKIMVDSMKQITPDIDIKVESCLMENWNKKAEPEFNEKGELIPWSPA